MNTKPTRLETIRLFLNPNQLRRMATDMERRMSTLSAGSEVWSESFNDYDSGLTGKLMADQDWFHRRADGIPDWDEVMTPGPEALGRFIAIQNEEREFPDTYSGTAWKAAYRMWLTCAANPEMIEDQSFVDKIDIHGLGLTGFQWGWARNAVRHMLGMAPGSNPAIIVIGGGENQPIAPASGPAEMDMRRAIGGD